MLTNNIDESTSADTRDKVQKAVNILIERGLDYQSELIAEIPSNGYEFMLPKSKNYRYYITQLAMNTSNARIHSSKAEKPELVMQGTIEQLSVGAMCEVVKQEMSQGKLSYEPYDEEPYLQSTDFDAKNQLLQSKVNNFISKLKASLKPIKPVLKEQVPLRIQQSRRENGANSDGSLGAWGGKKYQGLGSRDEFTAFRRQKSQNYYSNLSGKNK